mgnify:CR=1 FL=1
MKNNKRGLILLLLLALVSIGAILQMDPIVQDENYHQFSDENTLFGIPNFWNVISNLPFILVGLLGYKKLKLGAHSKWKYQLLFAGIALVGLGSGYYHWMPSSETLVWDRLPMTITFMTLFAIIISEFVSVEWGNKLTIPLIILGFGSILYWRYSPSGDLRPYALVQFYPLLAIPIILTHFKSKFSNTSGYWYLLLAYVLAKFCEHFDQQIHDSLSLISGHSLKHIFAAAGLYCLFYAYRVRELK